MRRSDLLILLAAMFSLSGCASLSDGKGNGDESEAVVCREPRPQVCTMDYVPVCGRLRNGEKKTYMNPCSACSDPDVVEYFPEPCD